MGVSEQHERLVSYLIQWVTIEHGGLGDLCILADHVSWKGSWRPDSIGGFIPDLHAKGIGRRITIIGEAETDQSLQGTHTKQQLTAFLDFLMFEANPFLVIAVPWCSVPEARCMVNRILVQMGNPPVQVVILEGLE